MHTTRLINIGLISEEMACVPDQLYCRSSKNKGNVSTEEALKFTEVFSPPSMLSITTRAIDGSLFDFVAPLVH